VRIPLNYVPPFLHAYARKHKRAESQRMKGAVEMDDDQLQHLGGHSQMTASELVRSARHGDLM
jgi:hypothetical protein